MQQFLKPHFLRYKVQKYLLTTFSKLACGGGSDYQCKENTVHTTSSTMSANQAKSREPQQQLMRDTVQIPQMLSTATNQQCQRKQEASKKTVYQRGHLNRSGTPHAHISKSLINSWRETGQQTSVNIFTTIQPNLLFKLLPKKVKRKKTKKTTDLNLFGLDHPNLPTQEVSVCFIAKTQQAIAFLKLRWFTL